MDRLITWSPGVTLEAVEQQVIEKALRHFAGNKAATAVALGISPRSIHDKIAKYAKDAKDQEAQSEKFKRDTEAQLLRARGFHPGQFDNAAGGVATGIDPNGEGLSCENGEGEAGYEDGFQAEAGDGLESFESASPQLAMPMPKRQKVQDVLPKAATHGGARRRRG